MKLRPTTPASTSLATRFLLIFISLLFVSAGSLQMTKNVFADQYDEKIASLQSDIAAYHAEGAKLNSQAVSLKSALAQLANQKAAIQTQINISQIKYNQLIKQISDTEKKIKDNKDALGKTIADLYVDDKITPIEMLASSNNISDYLDKQEYRSSVRNELTSTISEIKDLKIKLEKQKDDIAKVLADQKSQNTQLAAKESEHQGLLNKTQGREAGYQQLIGKSQAAIDEARATQAALYSRSTNTGGYQVIRGNFLPEYITDDRFGSWNNINCPMVYGYMSSEGSDGNGGDNRGYGCRQCASYVAWKINQVKGYYPSWGNASNFGSHGTGSAPRAGTVAVLYDGGPGHVAWVETDPYISTSGSLQGQKVIKVSQYNFDYGSGYGMYSLMELSVNFFDTYRKL